MKVENIIQVRLSSSAAVLSSSLRLPRSVEEALAGFLPAAGRAPLVSVLDAVNFTTLLGLAANPPEQTERRQ